MPSKVRDHLNVGAYQICLQKEKLFNGCCLLWLFVLAQNNSILEEKEENREAIVFSIKKDLYKWSCIMGEFIRTKFDDFFLDGIQWDFLTMLSYFFPLVAQAR
ncbi:hypothetical protein Sjap_004904 [Stephania japonica]|uniref:Uncharacterized protein n=1 Tax=Stephania japonica TaxID=461633 RepID=A0AAP0PLB7_9MAGN